MISIRQIGEDDWALLRAVRLTALAADPHVFGSSIEKESGMTEQDWRGWLRGPDDAIFIVFDGDAPAGITSVAIDKEDPSRTRAVLWGSWLAQHLRGRGVSRAMYEARIDWARVHPTCAEIVVSHRESNLASKFANQKHGFTFTHAKDKQWHDGATEPECFYSLRVK